MQKMTSSTGKREIPSNYKKTALTIAAAVLVLLLVLLNLFTNFFSVVEYYGNGMEPSLHDRQILVIRKTDQAKQGDIVAFYYNNKVLVRRVICEGGRSISIDNAGQVTVDQEVLEEPYVQAPSIGQCNVSFPFSVPFGHYFVMGDNREIAMDSRLTEIGTIPEDRLIGKIIFTIG